MRYLITLIFTIGICFCVQWFALRASGGRTLKSESNFFSSLGRIQAGAYAKQEIMILGSSITGRLPDSAQGFDGISNMGCDGGNGIDTLRAIDQGILPSAPWIIIEANTLNLSLQPSPTAISIAMEGPWFKLGIEHSPISAYARPSAFFYSKLLERKIGTFSKEDAERGYQTDTVPVVLSPQTPHRLTPDEDRLISEISAIIGRLKSGGAKVIFVWLPPGRTDNTPPEWITALVSTSDSLWWDLGQHVPSSEIRLTDGVHMDSTSATRATGDLIRAVRYLEQKPPLQN
jgi:hypothetical protein